MYAVNALIALRLLDSTSLSLLGGQAHPQTNNRRAAYNCRWQKLYLNILGGALHSTEGQHTIVDGAQKVFYVLGGERVILSAQGLHTSYDAVSFLSTFSLKCCSLGGETNPQRGPWLGGESENANRQRDWNRSPFDCLLFGGCAPPPQISRLGCKLISARGRT
jgi:hypothetical protein